MATYKQQLTQLQVIAKRTRFPRRTIKISIDAIECVVTRGEFLNVVLKKNKINEEHPPILYNNKPMVTNGTNNNKCE